MTQDNKSITFKGEPIKVTGNCPSVGSPAPDFTLTANDMSDVKLSNFAGKNLIISVVPSLDTPVCSIQTKKFSEEVSKNPNIEVLTVSMDLPFAQSRWCGAEAVDNIKTASDYKHRTFGEAYGTWINDLGIHCRAIFVIGSEGSIKHIEYVGEIAEEPNYEKALAAAC